MDDVIYLISETFALDAYGVRRPSETKSGPIFCAVNDASRSEFFGAGRNGLNPAKQFTVFAGDYGGQRIVEHADERYAVYRTFHVPGTDYMEIYVERKGGTNGKES